MNASWNPTSQLGHSSTSTLGDEVQDRPSQASLKTLGSSLACPLPMATKFSKQTPLLAQTFLGLVYLAQE